MKKQIILVVSVIVLIIIGVLGYYLLSGDKPEEPVGEKLATVNLYYYNPEKDKDEDGNIKCSVDGLVALEREVRDDEYIIERTINLLIEGDITEQEKKEKGIETEFPLDGFMLADIYLDEEEKTLFLLFDDFSKKTVGGSCRVEVLKHQISETAKQFEAVDHIQYFPEGMIFQP